MKDRRPPKRNRLFSDSPLERDGFELGTAARKPGISEIIPGITGGSSISEGDVGGGSRRGRATEAPLLPEEFADARPGVRPGL